jgi:anaerobic selenocysteine-containing dehydrogenase
VEESLKKLDFLVDVDIFMTDSARIADVVLPACTSLERSELKIYAQRHVIWTEPAVKPQWESRSDAEIIFELAKRMTPEDSLMAQGYEACVDWILKPSGKMEFTSTILKETGHDALPIYKEPRLSPRSTPEIAKAFPLIFTTGSRLPMFQHSRAFRLEWTRSLRPDPMVDMNPVDAKERNIVQEDWVSLSTPRNFIRVKANLTERVPPGVVSMYHAYPEANVNLLIEPDYQDPISGYAGFKSLLCQVKKLSDGEVRS